MVCLRCQRPMYTVATMDALTRRYPSGAFGTDWTALNRENGWRSEWVPELCRECDTEHDHRKTPRIPSVSQWLGRRQRKDAP